MKSFTYQGSEVEQATRLESDVSIRFEKAAIVYELLRVKVFRS